MLFSLPSACCHCTSVCKPRKRSRLEKSKFQLQLHSNREVTHPDCYDLSVCSVLCAPSTVSTSDSELWLQIPLLLMQLGCSEWQKRDKLLKITWASISRNSCDIKSVNCTVQHIHSIFFFFFFKRQGWCEIAWYQVTPRGPSRRKGVVMFEDRFAEGGCWKESFRLPVSVGFSCADVLSNIRISFQQIEWPYSFWAWRREETLQPPGLLFGADKTDMDS